MAGVLLAGATAQLAGGTASARDLPGRVADFETMQDDVDDVSKRAAQMQQRYAREFAPEYRRGDFAKLEAAEVQSLFKAAMLMAFYRNDAAVDDMRLALDTLEGRGAATERDFNDLYSAYVASRRFDAARALARTQPQYEFESLPEVIDTMGASASAPTELRVSLDANRLERHAVSLGSDTRIVVLAHPNCHFSRNASEAITANPELASLFTQGARWVAPPDGSLTFARFQEWNRAHPQALTSIVWSAKEWPLPDMWQTPTFYFLRDGKVVDTVTGWPPEGNREALLSAARRNGLLTGAAP